MDQVTILYIIISILCVTFAWNAYSFNSFKKQQLSDRGSLNDPKYWELKYKFEFLVAIGSVVFAVIAFLGYNSIDDVKRNLKENFASQVDSVKRELKIKVDTVAKELDQTKLSAKELSSKVVASDKRISSYKKSFSDFDSQQKSLRSRNLENKAEMQLLSRVIDTIRSKNIFKREFYIVNGLKGKFDGEKLDIFQFNKLKTIDGDNLPVFKSPPIVIPISNDNGTYSVARVTSNNVSLIFSGMAYAPPSDRADDQSYVETGQRNFNIMLLIYEVKQ